MKEVLLESYLSEANFMVIFSLTGKTFTHRELPITLVSHFYHYPIVISAKWTFQLDITFNKAVLEFNVIFTNSVNGAENGDSCGGSWQSRHRRSLASEEAWRTPHGKRLNIAFNKRNYCKINRIAGVIM